MTGLIVEQNLSKAKTLIRRGKTSEAIALYNIILAKFPNNKRAQFQIELLKPSQQTIDKLQEYCRKGQYDDAMRLALSLTNDFPQHQFGWKVLGALFRQLGMIPQAVNANQTAVALSPQDSEAHSNLGVTLKDMGRLEEAEASLSQAILLSSQDAEVHNNLGNTLKELGRLEEAEVSLRQAILFKPEYIDAMINLSLVLDFMNDLESANLELQKVLQINDDNQGLRARVLLAINNFLQGNFEESKRLLLVSSRIQQNTSVMYKNEILYHRYLLKILEFHEHKSFASANFSSNKTLYVIGESHSLTSHWLNVKSSHGKFLCKAKLIMGCMQWHLGNSKRNKYKVKFENIFKSLPKSCDILLAIGEIDCRLDSGIIKYKNKFPTKNIHEIILITVENYLTYLFKNNLEYGHNIIIQGVPCINIDRRNSSKKEVIQLIELIKIFNFELKKKSKEKGFGFLDVYKLTDRGDGLSDGIWHIDEFHLSSEGILEAWRRYYSD